MGRTLNISQGGMLLETHAPLDPAYFLSLGIGMDGEIMEIKAKVVHCKKRHDGKFESGIQFLLTNASAMRLINRHVKEFKQYKPPPTPSSS